MRTFLLSLGLLQGWVPWLGTRNSELGTVPQDADKRFDVPFDKLSEKQRKKVKRVMDDVTVVVPLDTTDVASKKEIYDFLLEELPFTADMCRELGRSKYEVFRDPRVPDKEEAKAAWRRTYYMNDQDGLEVKVELVLAEPNRRIYYTWGSYDLSPLPPVWGRSVIIVAWEEKDGKLTTDSRVYAQVDSSFYKAISDLMKGTVRDIVKDKSTVFVRAARWVSEAAAANPRKLYEQVKGSKKVDQEALELFREKFVK